METDDVHILLLDGCGLGDSVMIPSEFSEQIECKEFQKERNAMQRRGAHVEPVILFR